MGKRGGTIPSLKLVSSFDTILKYILGEREREREKREREREAYRS